MSEDTERIIGNGARARALLTDPLMTSVLSAMRKAFVDQFYSTPPEAAAQREMLHLMSSAQRRFEQTFEDLVQAADIEIKYRDEEELQHKANEMIDRQARSR